MITATFTICALMGVSAAGMAEDRETRLLAMALTAFFTVSGIVTHVASL